MKTYDHKLIAVIYPILIYLSGTNGIRTHNHLVRKRTLNLLVWLDGLAKWLSVRLQNKWLWVQISLL